MIVWRVRGEGIGPLACGVLYTLTKGEAERERRALARTMPGDRAASLSNVEQIVVRDKTELVAALMAAAVFGANGGLTQ